MEDELNMRLVFEEGDLISVSATPFLHAVSTIEAGTLARGLEISLPALSGLSSDAFLWT